MHPEFGVEIRKRFVHQEHARIPHQRPAERHALLLATGEFARTPVQEVLDIEEFGRFLHPLLDLRLRRLAHLQRERQVLLDRFVRIQRIVLEHHGDVAVFRIEIIHQLVANVDIAVRDLDQSRHQVQGRRFSAAGWADQRHELAILDREGHIVDRHNLAVGLDQIVQHHLGHGSSFLAAARPARCDYDLTAPSVKARTKYFCKTRKSTTTGTLMMNDAAISPGQFDAYSVKNRCRPTGKVSISSFLRKVSA